MNQKPTVVPMPPQPKKPKLRGLRINTVENVLREAKNVYKASRLGTISTGDGARLMLMLKAIHDMMLGTEIENRLKALEEKRGPKLITGESKRVDDEEA